MNRIRRIVLKQDEYAGDVATIVHALQAGGYSPTHDQAKELWQAYSDSMCAGWMMLPDSYSSIVEMVRPYFEVEGE